MDIMTAPVIQAFLAGLGSWFAISLGAFGVFARKEFSRRTLEIMLGAAGGMMLGATFWSLLMPSLELSASLGPWAFVPALGGLILGTAFLRAFDMFLPHIHMANETAEGLQTAWKRSILLVLAMALHHIPEGLAIGVGYGAAGFEQSALSLRHAGVLTLSIMLQGIPEGLVVALALRAEGLSAKRACFFGVLSGTTTPLGAVIGVLATGITSQLLPIALAFAAGAMLYIIVEDIIPESQASGHNNAATLALIAGVGLVMIFNSIF